MYDRREIHALVRAGRTQAEIADRLGVTQPAISYELSEKTRRGCGYDADYAQHRTNVRKKYERVRGNTIPKHRALQQTIDAYLLDDQSPEHTAERIRRYHPELPSVSGVTIRAYIASPYGRRIEAHRRKLTRRRGGRKKRQPRISDKRMIGTRPRYINARKRVGDAEGDFIVSGKDGNGMLLVVTDRKTRASFLEKIHPVSIPAVERAFGRMVKRFPEMKTLTLDNDLLFVHHKRLEKQFALRIYFCEPRKAWQKGGVENRNRIIRKYIPKGSDISQYSRPFIRRLEEKLQRRIMKCLRYKTPAEVLAAHRARVARKKKP